MRIYFLLTFFILAFYSCKNESDSSQDNKPVSDPFSPTLICQDISEDSNTEPKHDVYFLVNERKVKVATVSACDTILSTDYSKNNIPSSAALVVGGWWAGAGEYVYFTQEGKEKIVVYEQVNFEEDTVVVTPKVLVSFVGGRLIYGRE